MLQFKFFVLLLPGHKLCIISKTVTRKYMLTVMLILVNSIECPCLDHYQHIGINDIRPIPYLIKVNI